MSALAMTSRTASLGCSQWSSRNSPVTTDRRLMLRWMALAAAVSICGIEPSIVALSRNPSHRPLVHR